MSRREEAVMAPTEMRGFRRHLMATLHEYEGYLKQFEGKLLVLRGKVEKAGGEAAGQLGQGLAELEREAEAIKGAGLDALERLGHAVEVARTGLERAKGQLGGDESAPARVVSKGKEVVRKATIEAKALRHGVKVGLRVARRVSRRVKVQPK
jgi:hypothetical protein